MSAGDLLREISLLNCVFDDGAKRTVPVAEALERSDEIVEIGCAISTMWPAVMRQLLLPIVLDALGSPETLSDWAQRFRRGRFSGQELDQLAAYFSAHADRFDALHPDHPFGQVASLRTARGETKGLALLIATAATGNNVPLYSARSEGDSLRLPLSEAMLWLLHAQCWDTAAIKTGAVGDDKAKAGKTSGNPVSPLGQLGVVMPRGTTLYETLMLNVPVGAQERMGTPQWRQAPLGPQWQEKTAHGLLDLLTWQARRIRLFPEFSGSEVVVERVLLAAGDRLATTPSWEPHTAWKAEKPTKNKPGSVIRPKRHSPDKAAWQGAQALLAVEADAVEETGYKSSELLTQLREAEEHISANYPLRVEIFGISYGNQSAVIEDVIHDVLPLPLASLRGTGTAHSAVIEIAEQSEQLARALNRLSADLRQALGARPVPWDKGQRPGEQLLFALDPLIRRVLVGIIASAGDDDKLERGLLAWEQAAAHVTWRTAEPVFAVPSSAFAGRTVEVAGKRHQYKLGLAANSFTAAVWKILYRAAAGQKDQQATISQKG